MGFAVSKGSLDLTLNHKFDCNSEWLVFAQEHPCAPFLVIALCLLFAHASSFLFQTREEGKALLRQILQLRNQGETSSTEIATPFLLPSSLSANNTPTRRVSPLNLSNITP